MIMLKEEVELLKEQNEKLNSRIEQLLRTNSTAESAREISTPARSHDVGSNGTNQVSQVSPSQLSFVQVVRKRAKKAPVQRKSTPDTPSQNVSEHPKDPVQTIRIKSKDPEKRIGELLKSIEIPSDLKGSRTLEDGSLVLYAPENSKLKENLAKSEGIDIIPKPTFLPRIKVLFVPPETSEDDVTEALKTQSARLLRRIKVNNGHHFVYEVDTGCFNALKGNKIFLPDWTACRVVECLDAPLCTKCLKPGHGAANCNRTENTDLCAKCSKAGHTASNCQEETKCCINCKRSNRRDTAHSAFDQRCPELKAYIKKRQASTDYGPR